MAKYQVVGRLMEQESVAHQTYRMRIHCPEIAGGARPGQFLMMQIREGNDPLLRRPFSFHRIEPDKGSIDILYRLVGRGTWLMSCMEPGDRLSLIGPLGNGFEVAPAGSGPIFVVAGGIGIAPLHELILSLTAGASSGQPEALHLFYGARTASELLSGDRLDVQGLRIHWATDDGSFGFHGYVTQLMERVVAQEGIRPVQVYSCGPLAMQVRVARWADREGVDSQLSLESLMACGFGACLGCALPARNREDPASSDGYLHVCKDGPIFTSGTILWDKIRQQQIAAPISQCV